MSPQPKKKSDLGKDWMTRTRKSREMMAPPEHHLIVTEGIKTEPYYFSAMKDTINTKYPGRVVLQVEGLGENTIALFERAKEIIRGVPYGFAHVWLVYDKDDFPAERFDQVDQLCHDACGCEGPEFHATWSNQCIEYWFLLHFCFMDADITREKYCTKLSEFMIRVGLGPYDKTSNRIFILLKSRLNVAIKNAEKIRSTYNESSTPSEMAPCTMMYQMMELFRHYLL